MREQVRPFLPAQHHRSAAVHPGGHPGRVLHVHAARRRRWGLLQRVRVRVVRVNVYARLCLPACLLLPFFLRFSVVVVSHLRAICRASSSSSSSSSSSLSHPPPPPPPLCLILLLLLVVGLVAVVLPNRHRQSAAAGFLVVVVSRETSNTNGVQGGNAGE